MSYAQSDEYVFRIEPRNRERLDDDFVRTFAGQQPEWGPLGYVTFKRTYARRLTDEQRAFRDLCGQRHAATSTEEFYESIRRVTEGTFSVLRQQVRQSGQRWSEAEAQHKMREFYGLMWSFKFLPPGRGLGMMGTEAVERKGGACLNNCGMAGTANIDMEFATPFTMLMDYSMLGVGMGFDTKGAGKVRVLRPVRNDDEYIVSDTREGWCKALERVLNAFVGNDTLPGKWNLSQIRPEGSPIHTFGGTASGPGPLRDLLAGVEQILLAEVGKPISSTAIVDVMNMIGRCVVAGNVRRSAEIALGDPNDAAFLALKDPSALVALGTQQQEIARSNPEWLALEAKLNVDRSTIRGLSKLDPTVLSVERRIREMERAQKSILREIPAWTALEEQAQANPLRRYRWASNNTVLCSVKQDYSALAKQTSTNGEPGYAWLDVIQSYGRLSDPINRSDAKAIGTNPCSEQSLWDAELCNLVETFPSRHESLEDFKHTLKYAYLFAKVVTCIPTHNATTNAVITRNRRIGVSMAGIWEMYETLGMRECTRWWREGYTYIRELDDDYSGWMGVGRSIKVSSTKPGGTIPLLVGVEGGMKMPISRFYMRTIRIEENSPLARSIALAGYRVEPDLTTPRTVVAYFPCRELKAKRVSRDVSIWEQCELFTALQAHWSDNQVSATITFKPEEAGEIERVLNIYTGRWKSVSFLPLWDHQYPQAPYIPCSEGEYEAAIAAVKPLVLEEDVHDSEDKFCSGDKCEIVIP